MDGVVNSATATNAAVGHAFALSCNSECLDECHSITEDMTEVLICCLSSPNLNLPFSDNGDQKDFENIATLHSNAVTSKLLEADTAEGHQTEGTHSVALLSTKGILPVSFLEQPTAHTSFSVGPFLPLVITPPKLVEKHTRASQLNDYYTAAWCGDSAAHDHLCAAWKEPLASGYAALLKYFTRQYYDVEEGARLALLFFPTGSLDNSHAKFVFAVLQYHGVIVVQNIPVAVANLCRLADNSHVNAQCVLARHYAQETFGCDLSSLDTFEEQALRWYTAAAEQDHPEALYCLGMVTLSDPDCTDSKKAIAIHQMRRAAARGHPAALTYWGDCFRHGNGVPRRDENRALAIYQVSAEKNDLLGLFRLAECYAHEVGTARDPFHAARYFKRAADSGHPEACFYTGMNHFNGTGGIPRNNNAAFKYFQKAVNASVEVKHTLDTKTIAKAEYMLGLLAMISPNASAFPDLPVTYFMRASDKKHILASIELVCYLTFVLNTDDTRAEALTLLDDVVDGLQLDEAFAVLLPLAAGVHPHILWRLACNPAGEYAYYYENEHPPCEFHASPLWIQDAAPLLKVGLLLLALRPAHPEQHSRDHLLSALHLLQSPLRQVNRTVVCVCDSEKAIEVAYTALV